MMIQDLEREQYRNQFQNRAPQPEDQVLAFREQQLLVRLEEEPITTESGCVKPTRLTLPTVAELPQAGEALIYAGAIGTQYFYLTLQPLEAARYQYEEVRALRTSYPKNEVYAAFAAYHLYQWYRDNQFCGRCGKPLLPDKRERMLYCSSCKTMVYPRINPVVIVAVTCGERLLLTKYAGHSYTEYALVAGFAEYGETIEQTVAREVSEEVGLQLTHLEYYKSQPWAFSSSLLLGFFAEVSGDTEIHLQEEELSVGEWKHYQEITLPPDDVTLTREMILEFVRRCRSREESGCNRKYTI